MPSRVILDVGDVLHCYKKAMKGQGPDGPDGPDPWKGLEIVLAHFGPGDVSAIIPQRHLPDVPNALKSDITELVAAPKGFSRKLLESVAALGGHVLSNRELDLTQNLQIHFSFSSRGRFFCFSKLCEPSEALRSLRAVPAEYYIGSDAETEKLNPSDRPSSWSGKRWIKTSEGSWRSVHRRRTHRSHGSPSSTADEEFAVPFLGQSESLLEYLEELDSKLWQMGLGLRQILPWWDVEEQHWSLKSLKLRGSRGCLQALSDGSFPVSLWCPQMGSNFPVLFLCRKHLRVATSSPPSPTYDTA